MADQCGMKVEQLQDYWYDVEPKGDWTLCVGDARFGSSGNLLKVGGVPSSF